MVILNGAAKRRLLVAVGVALGSSLVGSSSQGQVSYTYSTTATSNAWLSAANWSPAVIPGVQNNAASTNTDIAGIGTFAFTAGSGLGINMNTAVGNLALGAIDFTSTTGAVTLGNSSTTVNGVLTLNGATVNSVANTLVAVRGTQNFTIANLPSGATTQTMGLRLGTSGTAGTFQAAAGRTLTISSIISEKTAGTGFTFNGGAGSGTTTGGLLALSGTNTFTGDINLTGGGRLSASAAANLGTGAKSINVASGTSLFLSAGTYAANTTINIAGIGFFETTAPNNLGALRLAGGASIAGNLNLTANARIGAFAAGDTGTISGVVDGGFRLEKSGSGTITLSNAANTYSGGTLVSGGQLIFSSLGSIGGSGTDITIASTGTAAVGYAIDQAFLDRVAPGSAGSVGLAAASSNALDFSGANLTSVSLGATGAFTYSGTLTPANNTYRLGGGGGTLTFPQQITGATTSLIVGGGGSGGTVIPSALNNDYGGGTTISNGLLQLNTTTSAGTGNIVFNNATGITAGLTLNATGTYAYPIDLGTSTGQVTLLNNLANTTMTLSGPLTGGVAGKTILVNFNTNSSANVLALTNAANTFTGTINVNRGVLRLDNATAAGTATILLNTTNQSGGSGLLFGGAFTLNNPFTFQDHSVLNTNGFDTGIAGNIGGTTGTTSAANPYRITGGTLASGNSAGTLTLSGNNSFTAFLQVDANTKLVAASNTALGGGTNGVAVVAGGTLAFSNTGTMAVLRPLTINGTGTQTGGVGGGALLGASGISTYGGPIILASASTVGASSGASLTLNGVVSGAFPLTKVGPGTVTLGNSANTFSGTTTISEGTLRVRNGSLQAAQVVTVADGAGINFISTGTAAALNSLTVGTTTGASLGFDLAGNPTIASLNVPIANGLVLNGTTSVKVSSTSPLAIGQFPLFSYTTSIGGGGFASLSLTSLPPRVVANLVNNTGASRVDLNVTATDSITWTGAVDGSWDINTTANWKTVLGNAATNYLQSGIGDAVAFGEIASGTRTVTLTSSIQPAALSVNTTSTPYTFQGAGKITGATPLVKTGSGTLILATNNDYTGGTTISGGVLQIGAGGTTGSITGNIANSGTVIFNRSDSVTFAGTISGTGSVVQTGPGTLVLSTTNTYTGPTSITGGTLQISADTNLSTVPAVATPGSLVIGSGGTLSTTATLTLNANRGIAVGPTTGSGSGTLQVASGTTLTANSIITDNGGTGGLVMSGGGSVILGGNSTFSGGFTQNAGPLTITTGTALGTGTYTIGSGAATGASSTVSTGMLTVNNAAAVTLANAIVLPSPAAATTYTILKASTGQLNLTGNISGGNANTTLFLNSATSGDSTTTYRFAGNNTFRTTFNLNRGGIVVGSLTGLGDPLNNVILNPNNNTTLGDLRFEVAGTYANPITLQSATAINPQANAIVLSGNLNGAAAWQVIGTGGGGTGSLILTGASNASTGTLTVQAGGTIVAGNGGTIGSLGTAPIVDNGTVAVNRSDSVTVTNLISGTGGFSQRGTGTATLSANNTFTGLLSVNAGSVVLPTATSVATKTVSVSSGASLDVSGISGGFNIGAGGLLTAGRTTAPANDIVGSVNLSNSTLNVGGTGTAATISVSGDLALDTATLRFDLANTATPGSGVNDLVAVAGNLSLANISTVQVNQTAGGLASGNYTLMTYGGILSGDATNLALAGIAPGTTRQTFAFNTTTTPGAVLLGVTGTTASLTWVGDGISNTWDVTTTTNWLNGVTPDKFFQFDNVTFGNTGSATPAINIADAIQASSVTVNSTQDYTFQGTGKLTGTGSLTKSGTGTLTLATDNDYTGGTTVSAGALQIGAGGTTGSIAGNISNNGSVRFNRSDAVTFAGVISGSGSVVQAGSGTLILSATNTYTGSTTVAAGTLQVAADANLGTAPVTPTAGSIVVNAGATLSATANLTLDPNRGIAVGPTTGSGTATFAVAAGTLTTNAVITNNAAGTGAIAKTGAGTLVLGGANTFTGGVTLSAGIINITSPTALGTGTLTFNGYNRLQASVPDGQTWTLANNMVLPSTGTGGEAELIRTGDGTPTAGTTLRLTGVLSGGAAGQTYTLVDSDQTGNHTNALILDNPNNTFAGTIETWRGTLAFTSDGALGSALLRVNSGGNNVGLRFDANNITLNSTRAISLLGNEAIDTQANTGTIAGVISGSALRKNGTGTLILTGANTFTGALVINQGTVQVGNGGTTGTLGTGAITNTGVLVFNRSDDITVANAISGTGTITKLAGNVVTLSTAVTGAGGTSVQAGTLTASGTLGTGPLEVSNTNTGAGTNVTLNLNTAAQTVSALSGTIATPSSGVNTAAINLAAGQTLTVNQATDTTYAGTINGATGSLVKTGAGKLTLSGTNTYAGATTVTGGTLDASAGSIASSIGAATVTGNGSQLIAKKIAPSTITIGANAKLVLTSVDTPADQTGRSSAGTWDNSGLADVGKTGIVIGNATEAVILAQILAARGSGAWTGLSGITSSNAAANPGTRSVGYVVSGNQITVAQSVMGDSNLDGITNIDDLSALAQNYNLSSKNWQTGDFNYDGTVNIDDLSLLAQNYNQTAGDLEAPPASNSAAFAADYQAVFAATPVPEPTTAGLLAIATTGLLAGRRRRRA